MKKICCVLLMLLISLFTCFPACAEMPSAVNLTRAHANETASSLCFIEDTLYMLGSYGVYKFKDNELSTVVDLSDANIYRYNPERPTTDNEALVWDKAIGYLFTDGRFLLGLHPYSGQIYQIANGQMNAYAQLPLELLYVAADNFYREIKGIAFEGGKLYLLLGTDNYEEYEKTELVSFDFASQTCEAFSLKDVKSISTGAEGKLLVYIESDDKAIWQYDINTKSLEAQLALLKENNTPGGMTCYNQKPVYYQDNQVIIAENVSDKHVKAYLPVAYSFSSTQAVCSKSGIYAYPDSNYVFLRDISIDGEPKQKVLKLMGSVAPNLLADFSVENPDVAVVINQSLSPNELQQAIISGDTSVDLFVLSAPGIFSTMKEKGYIAPLNENKSLVVDAKTLYPTIQDVVFDGDALVGYPISIDPQSWTVNETQWENLGLGNYPVTYDELFQTIGLWLDSYAEEHPEYTLSDVQQLGIDNLVFTIVETYIAQKESRTEQIFFDTPTFRSMLKVVSENLDLLSADNEQWGMPLLSSYNQGFGITYADRDRMRMMLPPTIEADAKQLLTANVSILCVSARSKQAETASKFIEYFAAHLPDATRYALHSDLNNPVESATYKDREKTLQEELEALKTQLETADGKKKLAIEDEIAQKQLMIEYVTENKWDISPESIEIYRAVAENLYIPYQSLFLSRETGGGYDVLRSIISQHTAEGFGDKEIEAMIADLDRVSSMIYMESM